MSKLRIAVICGGASQEHEVSLQSAKNIVEAIDKKNYDIHVIGIEKTGEWGLYHVDSFLKNADDPAHITLDKKVTDIGFVAGKGYFFDLKHAGNTFLFDVLFPIVHGTLGEDGSLQGLLRLANVPYVGPDVLSSALCMDKEMAKIALNEAGIKVAKGFTFRKEMYDQIKYADISAELGLPMFIKPANQGSSVGVHKVESESEFKKGIQDAFQYDHKVLVEEALVGREIECAVLGNRSPRASKAGEIVPNDGFYSYESKYIDEDGAGLIAPASLTDEELTLVQETAIHVFKVMQCEGLARVDFFLTDHGDVYVNEVNTLPGFTKISMYPKLWEVTGISYPDLIQELIELAIERHHEKLELKSGM